MGKKAFTPLEVSNLNKKCTKLLTGFTLTELILTILIIGILAAITLPRLGGKDFFVPLQLKTVAHRIASDIRYTRRLAVTDAVDYIIDFDFRKNEYGIYKERVRPTSLIGEIKQIPPEISLSGTNQFTFGKLGNATSGGTITLINGDYSYNIIIESVTGAAIMERIS